MKARKLPLRPGNLLSVFEGLEGGFAIFTGVVAGLSFTTSNRHLLIMTGIISILVSGFNSSAVKYSSEHYADELDGHEKHKVFQNYLLPAIIEFAVYVGVCLVVLLPLLFIDSLFFAVLGCIILTLFVMTIAGYYRGRLLRTHPMRDAKELFLIGFGIIAVGIVTGWFASYLLR